MDNATYVTLTRQSGLLKELQTVANNVANMATAGYRAEGVVFAEIIKSLPTEGGAIAMTDARVRFTSAAQGGLSKTNGQFDLAIQGDGFFLIDHGGEQRLTRAGAFTTNPQNELVTMEGYQVLDEGGAPVFVPPDAANIAIAPDGTMSAEGQPVAKIGLFTTEDPSELLRADGVTFTTNAALLPAEEASVSQGYVEDSNVNPIWEINRMIEVQRAYELGQKFLDKEDERMRAVLRVLGTSN